MANEISYKAVRDSLLSEVGNQYEHYTSKFSLFLDSIDWYNGKKSGACTWCAELQDWAIAVNKGNLSYEQARVITCEPANHKNNCGAGVKYKAQYFKDAKRWIDKTDYKNATTGDQIFLDSLNHVGGIVDWDKTGFIVVDGSTTYEGKQYCVGKKHIPYKSNRIVGFGRPDWYKYQTLDNTAPDPKPVQNSSGYTDEEIQAAYDCIEGKYGNGMARGNNLQKAGFDYYRVQGLVNKILKGQFKR